MMSLKLLILLGDGKMLLRNNRFWDWILICSISLTILGCNLLIAETAPASLRAGAATSNITPWLGVSINGGMRDRTASHIHDELHARCLALDDGKTRFAIVACDSCVIHRDIFDAAKKIVKDKINLPTANMLMCATHSHSAPTACGIFQSDPDPQYQKYLSRKIADAVIRAFNNITPARIGWGVGKLPQHVFNRRWKMKPGTIPPNPFGEKNDQARMNPPVGSKDLIEPIGPTDPEVLVLSVQHADGRPLALVSNYALHYVGGTGAGHISADYFGMFADLIQQRLGADRQDPPFVAMLTNGCSGDINNINFRVRSKSRPPYEQMRRVATDLADEVFRVCQSLQYKDRAKLNVAQKTLQLALRLPSPQDVEKAQKILAQVKGPILKTLPEIYARETVLLAEYKPEVEIIVQALQIGDLAIVATPCENFVEIGLEIKSKSPFHPTFIFELANGYNGYMPTVAQHKLGGYETWRARSSCLEVNAAPKVVDSILDLLRQNKEKSSPVAQSSSH